MKKIKIYILITFFPLASLVQASHYSSIYTDLLGNVVGFENIGYEYSNFSNWGIGVKYTHLDNKSNDAVILKSEYIYSFTGSIFESGWNMATGLVLLSDRDGSDFLKDSKNELGLSLKGGYSYFFQNKFSARVFPEIWVYREGITSLIALEAGYNF